MSSGVLVVWLLCAIVCAGIAHSKNRSIGWAVAFGILFGFGGIIIELCLRKHPPALPGPGPDQPQ